MSQNLTYKEALAIVKAGHRVKREIWKTKYWVYDVVNVLVKPPNCWHYGWKPSQKDRKANDWVDLGK